MAKFLTTSGISYHLEELIKSTNDRLVLISPYLQINNKIKELIKELDQRKQDTHIVYRDYKISQEDAKWFSNLTNVETKVSKHLHSKCYLNESQAIICSMNLYEFSQVNNDEMGILISKADDPDLYESAYKETTRLLLHAEEVMITTEGVKQLVTIAPILKDRPKKAKLQPGYCIRTGVEIPFDMEKPMSFDAYKKWNKYADPSYPEKFCHFSGEPSKGETSVNSPILRKNWKKAKEVHDF